MHACIHMYLAGGFEYEVPQVSAGAPCGRKLAMQNAWKSGNLVSGRCCSPELRDAWLHALVFTASHVASPHRSSGTAGASVCTNCPIFPLQQYRATASYISNHLKMQFLLLQASILCGPCVTTPSRFVLLEAGPMLAAGAPGLEPQEGGFLQSLSEAGSFNNLGWNTGPT